MLHDRRRSDRFSLRAPVECRLRGRVHPATVYDVSFDGCMVEGPLAFAAAGDTISITFRGEIQVVGRVIWAKARNAGVEFESRMEPATMERVGLAPREVEPAPPAIGDRFGRTLAGSPRLRRSPWL